MSTCPEKDIHSIYIDNELPVTYVAEYEAHVKNCPRCQAELARLRALRQSFSSDSKNMTLTPDALDASFNRLQARLSYSKVTQKNVHSFESFKNNTTLRYIAGIAAAAAIIAIVLPVRARIPGGHTAAQFQPVARTKIQSPADADVKVDGAINTATLSSLLGSNSNALSNQNAVQVSNTTVPVVLGSPVASSSTTMYGIPVFISSDDSNDLSSTLTSYDVFCPLLQDDTTAGNTTEVSIKFNASLGHVTLEIGSTK